MLERIRCPSCSATFAVETAYIGTKATCRKCGLGFLLERTTGEVDYAVPPGQSNARSTAGSPVTTGRRLLRLRNLAVAIGLVWLCYTLYARYGAEGIDPTTKYWNAIYDPHDNGARFPEWQKEWPAFVRRVRDDLSKCALDGVDPLAVGTAQKLCDYLGSLAEFYDHLNWMNEHPVLTDMSAVAGGEVHPKWEIKANECKLLAIEYNNFSKTAFDKLSARNKGHLYVPTPFKIGAWDEAVLKAKSSERALADGFKVGFAVTAMAFGG
jgi:hypothetical protein